MIEVKEPGTYWHFIERDTILNGELVYLVERQRRWPPRVYVDDIEHAKAFILHWTEPGESTLVWVMAEDIASAERALDWLTLFEPERAWFLIVENTYDDLAIERFEPIETGHIRIYWTGESSFRPREEHDVADLGIENVDEIFELARGRIIWDLDYLRWMMGQGSYAGVYEGGQLVSFAGAVWRNGEASEIGVCTHPDHQRMGMGRSCVSRVTRAVMDAGYIPFYQTTDQNVASWGLCESLGYKLRGTRCYLKMER